MIEHVQGVYDELATSSQFVMEALPEREDITAAMAMMSGTNAGASHRALEPHLYKKMLRIMQAYGKDKEEVKRMYPWAIYLTMNYPAESGLALDFHLLRQAKVLKMQLVGLETMVEQLSWFKEFKEQESMQLLRDSVCYYERLQEQFEEMIAAYLGNDVPRLYAISSQYIPEDDSLYVKLADSLLLKRNRIMVDRMKLRLEQGDVFIAIGAMHLPGKEGVLSLLQEQGYQLTPLTID